MSESSPLIDRFQAMPRAMRWLVLAGGFTLLVFAWDMTLGQLSREWNESADRIVRQVVEVNRSGELNQRLRRMEDTIVGLGVVDRPGSASEGEVALTRAYNEVIKKYPSVTPDTFDTSGGGDKLPKSVSQGVARDGNRLARLTGTMRFRSSAEDAIAIIADFESHPDIESVSKIRITKDERRKVKVSLTLETWIEVSGSRR